MYCLCPSAEYEPQEPEASFVMLPAVSLAFSAVPDTDMRLSHHDVNNHFVLSHHSSPKTLAFPMRPSIHMVVISVLIMAELRAGGGGE